LFPPNIYSIDVSGESQGFSVTWKTDEPASSRVDYGLSTSYELGSVSDPVLKTSHSLTVTGLSAGTTYHLRLRGDGASGNTGYSADLTVGTGQSQGPNIVLWYGDTQEFGQWGVPQEMVNLLGNVSSSAGVSSLSYSLNNGAFTSLNMGPTLPRLAGA